MEPKVEKLIVAVHGIGDQTRFATIQQVLGQFAHYHGKAAAVPLGSFHGSPCSGCSRHCAARSRHGSPRSAA